MLGVQLKRVICLAILSAMLACTTPGPKPRKAGPGYRCTLERRGAYGLIAAEFEVRASTGPESTYLKWDAGNGEFANPWITAAWFQAADGKFRLSNGYVSIMRHIHDPKRRPLDLKLHLRTAAGSLSGRNFERSAGPYHFRAAWSEVAALARGATQLRLVAIDRKHRIVDEQVIDSSLFARAAPEVEAAMRDLEAMIADPARTCTFVDDFGTDEIVVT